MAQRVIVVLLNKYSDVQDEANVVPLSYGIARNVIKEGCGQAQGEPPVELPDTGPGAEEHLQRSEELELLERSIQELGDRCRKLIRMRLGEKTTSEIAQAIDESPGTLFVIEHRCRKELKAIMLRRMGRN
jgi:RNA polymerase sigma factor (sigma-70 family)